MLNMNPNAIEIVRIGTDKVQCMVLNWEILFDIYIKFNPLGVFYQK